MYLNECGIDCDKNKLLNLLTFTPNEKIFNDYLQNLNFKLRDINSTFYGKFMKLINSGQIIIAYPNITQFPDDLLTRKLNNSLEKGEQREILSTSEKINIEVVKMAKA